jgi:murein biosynthesis integral membrane protein MurJ
MFPNQAPGGFSPLVTVAMPVFNAGGYLRLAVLSIVRQTFTDWELLIIDDGSTDNALQDIADIRDKRIRILQDGANKGLAARLNEAIDLARGRYFARMDQDDVSYPERFARQIEVLANDPQLDLVGVRAITISGNHQLTGMLPAITQDEIAAKPWRGFYLPHPTWMGRIEWFRKYRYTEPGLYFCEDQELLLRSHEQSRFGMIGEPLFAYRLREEIPWRKLIKTRLTVLPVQLRYFFPRRQFLFALMAILTFVGRLVLDVLRPVLGITYPLVSVQEAEIYDKWQNVLNFIQDGAGDRVGGPVLRDKVFNPLKHISLTLWVIFFCYAICAALIFQKLLLPLVSSMHAGGGLLSNDAAYFDALAWDIAQWVHLTGWSQWQPFAVAGNVTIISLLYMLFGHDPALIIPVNAAIHAMGGLLIFLLTRVLTGKEPIGTYAGIVAASLFVLFPSALNWFGQLHKDGYAIAGTLLILFTWLKAVRLPNDMKSWITLLIGHGVGVLMVFSVRPYNLKVLLVVTLGALLAIVMVAVFRRQLRWFKMLISFFLIAAVTLVAADTLGAKAKANQKFAIQEITIDGITIINPFMAAAANMQATELYADWQDESWNWRNTSWLPDGIERNMEIAAKTRAGLIVYGLQEKAKSLMDPDIKPQSMREVFCYLPRALQVAVFAPFPSSWLNEIKITRMVAAGEMLIYYLCFPGLLFLLWYHRRPEVWLALYFSCFFLMVLGFTTANLGTLYRVRYGYFFILLLMGVSGWFTLLDKVGWLKRLTRWMRPPVPGHPSVDTVTMDDSLARKKAMGRGFLVMFLTFLCFLGFFLRDLLMAKTFGLGASLDYFFIALMIPMFMVTVFYMPLGAAFVPTYLEARENLSPQSLRDMVSGVSSWMGASLIIACLILYLCEPSLLPLLYARGSLPDMGQLVPLLNLALPILLFSGVVILGNSILNANGRAALASSAQLIVPVAAIIFLLLFGNRWGVKAVLTGMVIGQLLNLFIVQYFLNRDNIRILPRLNFQFQKNITSLWKQYWPLVASALFVSLVIPVSMMLAMSLPEGSVSAFNLGTKVVLFVTGLVDTAILAVMLPYFSLLVARNRLVSVKRELSFFLLLATFIAVPVSALIFLWSEPIVRLIFEGGSFGGSATEQVTRVMQYYVVQLPFFICNSLLLKFSMANRRVIIIGAVAFIALLVNIGAGLMLMKHMGVGGIALGTSLSMLVSTVLLLLVLLKNGYVTGLDAVIMLMNWLLFITLLMCIHFQSIPSIYVTIIAYVVLMGGYAISLKSDKTLMIKANN